MFDDVLIESGGADKTKGRGVTAVISAVVHIAILAFTLSGLIMSICCIGD